MGGCCSTHIRIGRSADVDPSVDDKDFDHSGHEEDDDVAIVEYGARMRIHGASKYISMFTQRGKKGVNQDAMVVWEEFTGDKDMFFCGVFDGHGPYGHKVSRLVRNTLPARLSSAIKAKKLKLHGANAMEEELSHAMESDSQEDSILSAWESCFVKCFKDMDEELSVDSSIDSFCSGATAVTVVKKGHHLVIGNLGDSRALLCQRGTNNQLIPVQLTTDLKPNIPSEAERIKKCKGRVFALAEEPEVFRTWMPDEDCPGLAMARAFGDFCLKDYGLISVPQVSYRKLTMNDEFVVLATDGIWDVLSNTEVVNIVASVRNQALAAKVVVKYAVRAWRTKYPGSKVDDCAVVCLFLKRRTTLTRTFSEVSRVSMNHTELAGNYSEVSKASIHRSEIATVARVDSLALRRRQGKGSPVPKTHIYTCMHTS